ncbi:MAG: hypothetical protein LAO31_13425 [Acidobacteriia bacterium]|nr:hypothetical protein [Terriglobia bacterium]
MRLSTRATTKILHRRELRLISIVVLCAFSFFSFALSQEHTCLIQQERDLTQSASAISGSPGAFGSIVYSHSSLSSLRGTGATQSDGICLACAWSQSLIKQVTIVQLVSPSLVNSLLLTPSHRVIPFLDLCLATQKRGPPRLFAA